DNPRSPFADQPGDKSRGAAAFQDIGILPRLFDKQMVPPESVIRRPEVISGAFKMGQLQGVIAGVHSAHCNIRFLGHSKAFHRKGRGERKGKTRKEQNRASFCLLSVFPLRRTFSSRSYKMLSTDRPSALVFKNQHVTIYRNDVTLRHR